MDNDAPTPINAHQEGWWEFKAAHPDVWQRMVRLAKVLARPRKRFGIELIFAQLRWREHFARDSDQPFKLNNSWRAYASRDLIEEFPEVEGLLETRIVRTGIEVQ